MRRSDTHTAVPIGAVCRGRVRIEVRHELYVYVSVLSCMRTNNAHAYAIQMHNVCTRLSQRKIKTRQIGNIFLKRRTIIGAAQEILALNSSENSDKPLVEASGLSPRDGGHTKV